MAHSALAAALLAAAVALPAGAAPKAGRTKAFPFPTESVKLPNGLTLVLVKTDSPGLVAYYTLVRVGSRNEPEAGKSGFAHFFEHMMFRGTKKHPADEYANTITRLGLDSNAFTSEDMTVYHLYGPAQALPTVIEYEADRFQNLEYTEAQFRTEAGAILGEYAKSASNPELKLEEKLAETAFNKHTYRHTTIGYLDDVKAMPEGFDYARQFFGRYYKPDNAVVVISGDFDRAKAIQLVRKHYGTWKGKARPAAVPKEPPQTEARRASLEWPTPTLARVWLAWHSPAATDLKSSAAANVLEGYLFGPTSELYQSLVLEKQIVDSLLGTYSDSRDPGLFGVLARVKDPGKTQEVEQAILEALGRLAKGAVDAKRMEAVRSNLKYGNILHLETPRDLAVTLARTTALTGDLQWLNKVYAQVDALKPQDLVAYAKKWLVDSNRTTVTLAPASAAKVGGGK